MNLKKDAETIHKVRDKVIAQMEKFEDGETSADSLAKFAYAGGKVAELQAVKLDIARIA
jgi:hypothetical protein